MYIKRGRLRAKETKVGKSGGFKRGREMRHKRGKKLEVLRGKRWGGRRVFTIVSIVV